MNLEDLKEKIDLAMLFTDIETSDGQGAYGVYEWFLDMISVNTPEDDLIGIAKDGLVMIDYEFDYEVGQAEAFRNILEIMGE